MKRLITYFILASFPFLTTGSIIEIPADFPTIQEGILAAVPGDTVMVAPGIYNENINFLGKDIVVCSHYILHHDFDFIQSTIIDGSAALYPDTASCVRFVSGEGPAAELQGFTICHGTGTHWVDPQFPDWTWHSGGGIFIFQSSPTIRYNIIVNNHVDDPLGSDGASGGGLCTYGGNPLICNTIIKHNTALYGAGVVIDYSGCIFKNNIVDGNSGGQSYGGGGFWTIGNGTEPIIIENNTIVYNEAIETGLGGAMYLWSSNIIARNNILWGNTQPSGGPIHLTGGASIDLTYSNIEGGYTGEGNIDVPPSFADTNFVLLPASPCIDAGNSAPEYNDIEDPDNAGMALWPSLGTLFNDMGVYGGGNCLFLGVTTVGINDYAMNEDIQQIEVRCFPNPFLNKLHIALQLSHPQYLDVAITDSGGRRIITLTQDHFTAGKHTLFWSGKQKNGFKLVPGVYFCRVISKNRAINHKIIIAKE